MSLLRSSGRRALLALLLAGGAPEVDADELAVRGSVVDRSGAVVRAAEVSLMNAGGAVLGSARSDDQGTFALSPVESGRYLLVTRAPGLDTRRTAVVLEKSPVSVVIVLEPAALREEVTVTAEPGRVTAVDAVSQPVNVIGEEDLATRTKAVVAQIANGEVGLHLQRTSPTIAGIFVRGLTGNKVSVFVDGQRYSTGAMRGGINTFLDLVGPASLEGVEVLRGPSSAQYGSDALGGTVHFLTRIPPLSASGRELSGAYAASGNTADGSLGGELRTSLATPKLGLMAAVSGRRISTLRTGGGTDSHNALRRFFEVDPEFALDGGRLPDTAFSQYGGLFKLNWAASPHDHVVASYMRSQQDGGKRYDQLLGGDGNLVADLRNLMLDRASLKYDHSGRGRLRTLSIGYSYTAQREERVNQGGNGNPRAAVNHEYEKTRVHGVQAAAGLFRGRNSLSVGGDVYHERITAPSFGFNPVTLAVTPRRGRVPDQALYVHGGVFLQDVLDAVPERLRLAANLRWSHAAYEQRAADSPTVGGRPLWPDDEQDFSSVTFRAGAVLTPSPSWTLSANVGRGFRAPHVTDLGTVGLTGSGFETTPRALSGLGATIGTSAGTDAVTTGHPAETLRPERSLGYEAGVRFHRSRFSAGVVGFVNDIAGNIQKQALILPPGAVGLALGDQVIERQTAGGAVFVPLSTSPVLVNANFDDVRLWGIEHTLQVRPAEAWRFSGTLTYLHAEDRHTRRPPNVEGGTPPLDTWFTLRYAPVKARYWIEGYAHAAARQTRLSSLDREDRRTGAGRSRASIAAFFANGARARGLVGNGADGIASTPDDVLLATGETLAQIQTRVLGTAASSSLYDAVAGYAVFGLRGGLRFARRHEVTLDVENVGDRSYRGISWGVDAPGFGVSLRYAGRF
jgi:outer membrane receptor protein involved in Fe transport